MSMYQWVKDRPKLELSSLLYAKVRDMMKEEQQLSELEARVGPRSAQEADDFGQWLAKQPDEIRAMPAKTRALLWERERAARPAIPA